MNKSKAGFALQVKILILEVVLIECIYVAGAVFFTTHFLPNSYINGIEVSFLNADQARTVIADTYDQYQIELIEEDGRSEYIRGEDINLKYSFFYNTRDVMNRQSLFLWVVQAFTSKEYESEMSISYDQDKLTTCIKELNCVQDRERSGETIYSIMKTGSEYTIQGNMDGTAVDIDQLTRKLALYLHKMAPMLDLESEQCYRTEDKSDSETALQPLIDKLNRIRQLNITYQIGEYTIPLTGEDILAWVQVSDDLELLIDTKAVQVYLQTVIEQYRVDGDYVIFETYSGTMVRLPDYVAVDQRMLFDTEVLSDLILNIEKDSQTIYTWKCTDSDEETSMNIEIDLSNQMMYLYRNGAVIMMAPIKTTDIQDMGLAEHGVFLLTYGQLPRLEVMDSEQGELETGVIYLTEDGLDQLYEYVDEGIKIYIYSDADQVEDIEENTPPDVNIPESESVNSVIPQTPSEEPAVPSESDEPSSEEQFSSEETQVAEMHSSEVIEQTEASSAVTITETTETPLPDEPMEAPSE